MKHVIGQAVFQLIVMVVLVFAGDRFIPEFKDSYDTGIFANHLDWKWRNGIVGGTVRSGRMITVSGAHDYKDILETTEIYSRHFTFIFNTFVMLQLCNFISCRKIHEELNIFSGIMRNKLFIIIVGTILGLQIILITFGGQGLHVYDNYGLTV